jgi:hypothetical protein
MAKLSAGAGQKSGRTDRSGRVIGGGGRERLGDSYRHPLRTMFGFPARFVGCRDIRSSDTTTRRLAFCPSSCRYCPPIKGIYSKLSPWERVIVSLPFLARAGEKRIVPSTCPRLGRKAEG